MHNPLDVTAPGELETIAAARRILQTWAQRASAADDASYRTPDSYRCGMIFALSGQADDLVFDVLNVLASYAGVDVPKDVLHVHATDEPQPAKRQLRVVVDTESDPPELLGPFRSAEEDAIFYSDALGDTRRAPDDCVSVVTIAV